MSPNAPRTARAARPLAAAALLLVAASTLVSPWTAAAAPGDPPQVREVRSIWTRELGLARPSSLAFAPGAGAGAGELLSARPEDGGTAVLRTTIAGEALGELRLPATDPGTLAFDAFGQRLTGISGDTLIAVDARDLGQPQPAVTRTPIGGLGLVDPRAATFDPATGTWFVLDAGADAIVVVPPSLADATRISLADVGVRQLAGLAFDPRSGLLYTATADGARLLAIDRTGAVRRTLALGSLGIRTLSALTFAPSADPTDASGALDLYVADEGNASWFGGVTEVTLQQAAAVTVPVVTATLVQTILTSNFSPPSPDPSGVDYNPRTDRLFVSDSEVDETTGAGYHGANIWQTTRTGSVLDTGTTVGYSNEPTGLGFDPATNTLFVSDDDRDRIYLLRPGSDGRWGTSDDPRTYISVGAYGSTDTEDPEFDTRTGHLFFVDGISTEVFEIDPVDGTFGNADDVMTHFDVGQYGATDTEALAYDAARDILLVGDRTSRRIYEVTTTGALVRIVDASGVRSLVNVSGLTTAPASDGSGRTDDWIVDRAVDNGPNPNENDGKLFEISAPSADLPPSVSITSPADGATVAGTVTITAGASDDKGVTQVRFFDGTTTIATDTNGSDGWSASWNTSGVADGPHTLRATATDTIGQTASDTNDVTVDNLDSPPAVSITSPADGASVTGTVTIRADASDDEGVTQVRFFDGATTIATDTNGSDGWSASWNTSGVAEGGHTLAATATDTTGQTASDTNTVTVDRTAPTVSITAPIDGATVLGITTVTADAADDRSVASVQFFVDGSSIGTDASSQGGWSVDWNTALSADGAHVLTAVARDAAGNATTSAAVRVTVDNPVSSSVDVPVAAGSDDVEEQTSGSINATSTDLDLMIDNTTQQRAVGMRFTGIAVPRGATIVGAYVQFQADESSSDATTLTVDGHASDNSPAFTSSSSNVSTRTRTQASVTWTPVAWTAGARTADQRTPDVRSIVQEIVDRPGWASGNAMSLIVTGTGRRVAESFEGGVPPVLHIEFGTGGIDVPPSVSLTSPTDGATVSGTVTITADASDDAGVTQVRFFDGTTSLGTDTNGSNGWSVSWDTTTAPDGAHTLTATATDTAGQTASDSNAVTVDNVDAPPSVSITSPAEGATVAGIVTVTASAADVEGVTQVEFFDGATSLGADTNGSNGWSVSWNTTGAAEGSHTLTATATDTAGQTASDSNAVTVDNTAPSVAITSPAGGATVLGTIPVTADASDAGQVASVQFFADGASIGTDTNASGGWSVDWDTALSGNGGHDLTAVARDAAGNAATSPVVRVTVDNPPVVDVAVAASSDDAEQKTTNGTVRINSSDLELVTDKTVVQQVGLRFTGVTVPAGATIVSAYVQFRAAKTNVDATDLVIRAQAADAAPTFTTKANNISSRPLTTSSVAWSPPAWTAGARTADQRTPDLAAVVQEVVARAGWSNGNPLVLVIVGSGTRVATAFDGGSAPALHIEYSTP